MLKDLIVSRVRLKILKLFFLHPSKKYHLREIQRQTGEAMNAIRREMEHLQVAGYVTSEFRGNRKYYELKKDHPLYFDLLELINKTAGLGKKLWDERVKLGKIRFLMLSGRFVRGLPRQENDIDILLVGTIIVPELLQIVKEEETKRDLEINYTVMTEEEFAFRKQRGDPFVTRILRGSRIMILGDEEDLVK
jgi:DNA-binding transcriptional ArsR family regulator